MRDRLNYPLPTPGSTHDASHRLVGVDLHRVFVMQRIAISARSAGPALTSARVASVPWAIGVVLAHPLGIVARFALGHGQNVVTAGADRHNPSWLSRRREPRQHASHARARTDT